ncbi:hypothetical protein CHS0354_019908 [Potamilus streckersoni]|uniref:Uncharacterized protein n=1 Tax=Potamilus streckersoni TaxID=2493646 RepID=A0AAE0SN35_9BIVA|nr:hypothetical protein CHS0354_019908 [Potamilus streckersoni]
MTSSLPPPLKLTSGKRGPSGPLIVTTSDEDSSSDGEALPQGSPRATLGSRISPRYEPNVTPHSSLKLDLNHGLGKSESRGRPLSPTLQQKLAYDAYEHDHDYENVASPSGSSTASGPIYVRPPGFQHHAQEIKKDKVKKKKSLLEFREGLKKRAPTPPKIRARREPLPMRLRALPQSFWKQPNVPNQMSPANMFSSTLPPLSNKDSGEDVTEMRPITPPEEREKSKKHPKVPERKLIVGDTDLLLKHLFTGVMEEKKDSHYHKRGRPRKISNLRKCTAKGLLSGDDPYLVDAVSEKMFPQLTLEGARHASSLSGSSSLQLITLREGDKSVTLPSLSIEQNYSQMLSELVMNI